jgi:hypothetical protein
MVRPSCSPWPSKVSAKLETNRADLVLVEPADELVEALEHLVELVGHLRALERDRGAVLEPRAAVVGRELDVALADEGLGHDDRRRVLGDLHVPVDAHRDLDGLAALGHLRRRRWCRRRAPRPAPASRGRGCRSG